MMSNKQPAPMFGNSSEMGAMDSVVLLLPAPTRMRLKVLDVNNIVSLMRAARAVPFEIVFRRQSPARERRI